MGDGKKGLMDRLNEAVHADSFQGMSNALIGDWVDSNGHYFHDLREDIDRSNIDTLFRTYVSQMLLFTAMSALTGFFITLMVVVYVSPPTLLTVTLMVAVPFLVGIVTFSVLYSYPAQKASQRATNIENNLPFALNQMSAVAMSGVSPSRMFRLLQDFGEYEELAKEASKIIKKVEVFGEDVTTALTQTAQETPSEDFKEVLYGMVSTIDTGGSLKDFLDQRAETALFDYKLKRRRQIETLSTFASFYTALLVVAPLFMVVILSVMNLIGGGLFGYGIETLMQFGVYGLIPILNTLFIIVLEVTQGNF
mgnify:CR=1 FL=1